MATTAAVTSERVPTGECDRLEERILARDQRGASQVLYAPKQERPVTEITRETGRIRAPHTHVSYHQRLDDGVVKFVNNDHCLRSTPSVTTGASLALIAYAVALVTAGAVVDPVAAIAFGSTLVLLLALVHFAGRVHGAAIGPASSLSRSVTGW